MPCYSCRVEIPPENEVVTGPRETTWCRPCADDNLAWCENCDAVIHQEDQMGDPDGNSICRRCFERFFYSCNHCNRTTSVDDAEWVEESSVCTACYDNSYWCDHCEQSYFSQCTRHDGVTMHPYDYRPAPSFKLGARERVPKIAPMLFGVELEMVMTNRRHAAAVQEILDVASDWTYVKRDGSLPEGGFELVTHPLSWEWMIENTLKVNRLLYRLSGVVTVDHSCGMHVHMSKDRFSPLQVYRMSKLLYDYPQFAFEFSGREMEQMWDYCRPTMDEYTRRVMARQFRSPSNTHHHMFSVSTANPTVELRMFSGTLSPTMFWRNLQYCKALAEFTREHRSTKLRDFKSWVDSRRDYYRLSEAFQQIARTFHDEPDPEGQRLEV